MYKDLIPNDFANTDHIRMNILVVSQQFRNTRSGVGLHALNLVTRLLKDGHQVTLLVPLDEIPIIMHKQLKVETVPRPNHYLRQARWIGLAFNFRRAIRKIIKRQNYDIIHFTDARESFFLSKLNISIVGNLNDTYAADVRGLSYYLENYSDGLFRWVYYKSVNLLEKNNLSKLDRVIVNSKFTRGVIKKAYSLNNLSLCYKSVDLSDYKRNISESEKGNKQEPPFILFVGSNLFRKGIPDLLKALAILKAKGLTINLKVVGEENVPKDILKLTDMLGLCQEVDYLGLLSQQNLKTLYREASVFTLPSLTEALGVSILEALASNLPVIATRVGGIPEIIEHGVNGILVEPHDPKMLAGAIYKIITEPGLADHLRKNSLHTLEKFSLEQMMKCTYEIYNDVMLKRVSDP